MKIGACQCFADMHRMKGDNNMALVPYVIEKTATGERSYDIFPGC